MSLAREKTPKIAAIILAAGQSKRMQWPTPLLPLPTGKLLLEHQVDLLKGFGCDPVVVVTGAHTTLIRDRLPRLGVVWGDNTRWQGGTSLSLKIGIDLALTEGTCGAIVLPIGIVGFTSETMGTLMAKIRNNMTVDALRPQCRGKAGYPLYLGAPFLARFKNLDAASHDANLDVQLQKSKNIVLVDTTDAGVVNEIESPDDWKRYVESLKV